MKMCFLSRTFGRNRRGEEMCRIPNCEPGSVLIPFRPDRNLFEVGYRLKMGHKEVK